MSNVNLIDMINVVYNQRELFMKQIQLLFNDTPDSEKVSLFEKVFMLQEKERTAIKKVKENYIGDKALLEELHVMSSYNDKINNLLQETIAIHEQKETVYNADNLSNDILK